MITIKLQGGLGNQMFQYALAYNLSNNKLNKIKIDLSFICNRFLLNGYTAREYELDIFGIGQSKSIFTKYIFINYLLPTHIYKIFYKVIYGKKYIQENNGDYINKISNNCVYLDGYWQSYKYFENNNKIFDLFEVKTKINKKNLEYLNLINKSGKSSVSVHIRRGDYISNTDANNWHGVCSVNYYKNAKSKIEENIKKPVYFIFSDDIKWAKNNLDFGKNVCYIEGNTGKGGEDLRLMYNCSNHIIANSSFSWWGAYLGKNKNKIVIAPKKWLNNITYNTSNLLPKKWIKI